MEVGSKEELEVKNEKHQDNIRRLEKLKNRNLPLTENHPASTSTLPQGNLPGQSFPSNSDSPEQFKTYEKLAGTVDHGKEYEQVMCGYYALQLTINDHVKKFEITSNNKEYGKFDDMGVTITFTNGRVQKFLFQLKYKENKKININHLKSEKGKSDFGIKKYIKSILNMKVQEDTVFVLFTNSSTYVRGNTQLTDDLRVEQCSQLKEDFLLTTMLNTSVRPADVALFEIKSERLKQKFYFFTSQRNVNQAEEEVTGILEDLLQCNIYAAFSNYIKHWWFGKFVLTKNDVIAKISELALSPHLKILTDQKCNEKTESLRKTIMRFPLTTIIEECGEDIVENIWRVESTGDELSKAKEKYGLKESTILWYLGQRPLVVKVDRSNEGIIKRVMNFLRKDMGHKNIILCGNVTKTDFESWNTLESLWDIMKDCEDEESYSDITQNFRISLQGRGSLTLDTLVKDDEDIAKLIGIKELLIMSQQPYLLVGNQKGELPAEHIPRTISQLFVKIEDLLKALQSHDSLLIFNCDENLAEKLSENSTIHTMELSQYMNGASKNPNVILLSTRSKCTPLQFEKVCEMSKKGNVYLFQYFDDGHCNLVLRKGRELQFETTDNIKPVKESEIFKYYNNPLHVFCAPPGMGKSTLMRSMFNTCPSHCLAVFVNLINCNAFLAEEPDMERTFARFLHEDGAKNDLFKRLKDHLRRKQKLYVFLDGLDEVNSQYVKHVLNFAKHASSQGVNIWLSSRENLRDAICETLNAVPIDIKGLDKQEQEGYIRCKLQHSYKREEVREIINAVFNSTDLNNSQHLLGIPLQLHIITETFLQDKEIFEDLENKNFFVLTNMYKMFFEGKIKFSLNKLVDKNQDLLQFGYLNHILQGYELLALKTCLDHQDYKKLNLDTKEEEKFLLFLKTEGDKYGIIKKIDENDTAIFDHQTFAEYFACVWFRRNRNGIALLRDKIFMDEYKNLRTIFDVLLAQNNPLHLAVIYRDLEQLENHIEEIAWKDEGGRSVFHIAFSYGQRYKDISWELKRETPCHIEMIEKLLQRGENLEEKDALFELNCVDYALQTECFYPVERMLEKKKLTFDEVKEPLKRYSAEKLLIFTAQCGYPNLFSEFIKRAKDLNGGYLLESAIKGCRDDVCTPPRKGNIEVVQTLIDILHIKRKTKCEALETACRFKNFDMLEVLINNHAQCEEGNTILHLLVQDCPASCYKEILDAIKKFNIDVNERNIWGTPALHDAVVSSGPRIVEALMANGADPNLQDNWENNALYYVLCKWLTSKDTTGMSTTPQNKEGGRESHSVPGRNKLQIVEMLLKHGAHPKLEDESEDNALQYDSLVTANILLENGAKFGMNAKFEDGKTLLHLTCEDEALIEKSVPMKLLERGADANVLDDDKKNALYYSLPHTYDKDLIDAMIKHGLHLNTRYQKGRTLLHIACLESDTRIVRYLIEGGIDKNALDDRKQSPLHVVLGSLQKMEFSWRRGEVNAPHTHHETSEWTFGCQRCYEELEDSLIINGTDHTNFIERTKQKLVQFVSNHEIVDVFLKQVYLKWSSNARFVTARFITFAMINYLIQNGSQINNFDLDGNTELDFAFQCWDNYAEILELLRQYFPREVEVKEAS